MKIKIDHNIPPPVSYARGGLHHLLPFDKLKVGDSFFVSEEEGFTERTVPNAMQVYRRLNGGRRFTVRRQRADKNGPGGWRVWRVA